MTTSTNKDQSTNYRVSKKDFQLKKVEVIIKREEGYEVQSIVPRSMDWYFTLTKEELAVTRVRIVDAADREVIYVVKDKHLSN